MDRATKIGLAFGLVGLAGGAVLSALPILAPEAASWIVWLGLPIFATSLIYTVRLIVTWRSHREITSSGSVTVTSHGQSGGITAHTVRQGLDDE